MEAITNGASLGVPDDSATKSMKGNIHHSQCPLIKKGRVNVLERTPSKSSLKSSTPKELCTSKSMSHLKLRCWMYKILHCVCVQKTFWFVKKVDKQIAVNCVPFQRELNTKL